MFWPTPPSTPFRLAIQKKLWKFCPIQIRKLCYAAGFAMGKGNLHEIQCTTSANFFQPVVPQTFSVEVNEEAVLRRVRVM